MENCTFPHIPGSGTQSGQPRQPRQPRQQIRKPPNLHPEARRSVIVGKSPAKVADLRAGKSLVIVGKSKVAGKSPAKVAHSSESEDS